LEAESIVREFISQKIPTIVFARSRLDTEVLVTYLRKAFHSWGPQETDSRAFTRGRGYLWSPKQRRSPGGYP